MSDSDVDDNAKVNTHVSRTLLQPVISNDLSFIAQMAITSPPTVDAEKGFYREEQCRAILESLYPGHKFPSTRPEWLINPRTGERLELDGYCPELHLAFEYNGEQHYVYPNKFHSSKEKFLDYKARDIIKRILCDIHGVYLLVIPYTIPVVSLRSYIKAYLPESLREARKKREFIIVDEHKEPHQ